MRGLVGRLLATTASFGGLAVFVLSLHAAGEQVRTWAWVVASLAVCFAVLSAILEILDYRNGRPGVYRNDRQIRDFMYNWIRNGGRVAVSSRDLSWVNDDEMKALLRKKAERGELQLFMPRPIAISEELRGCGASVAYYDGPALRSRFTLVHCDRSDEAVAIGRGISGKHVIMTYGARDDQPAFWLAQDLVSVLGTLSARDSS